jgi:hypothetical protein
LPTSYAELAAVLPSALYDPPAGSLTLGDYVKKRLPKPQNIPQERIVPCGAFLDYGPYATFAPTFEQNGVEVGKERLSEVVWFSEKDKQRRARVRAYREQLATKASQASAIALEPDGAAVDQTKQIDITTDDDTDALEGLLTPEQIANLKSSLKGLELEAAVSELLDRNTKALARLEVLQLERLGSKEGVKDVQVDSEEWDLGRV